MTLLTSLLPFVGLAVLGVLVGSYGTLIGAGGGFVLVPVLLLLYPHDSPRKADGDIDRGRLRQHNLRIS